MYHSLSFAIRYYITSAIRQKKEVWKVTENIKVIGNQSDGGMLHLYGQRKKAAKRTVDKARNDMEAHLYTKLDEDSGKKKDTTVSY